VALDVFFIASLNLFLSGYQLTLKINLATLNRCQTRGSLLLGSNELGRLVEAQSGLKIDSLASNRQSTVVDCY
jgi:hypothetical protein